MSYVSKWVLSVLLGLAVNNLAQGLEPSSCRSAVQGGWLDHASLNSFFFDMNCNFTFQGANCTASGRYFSSEGPDGTIVLTYQKATMNSMCQAEGERICSFKKTNEGLLIDCKPDKPLTFKPINENANELTSAEKKTTHLHNTNQNKALITHLEQQARNGHAPSITALGYNYFHGSHGFDKNLVEAYYWNRLGAYKGRTRAKTLIATQYFYGLGVPKNQQKAEQFFLLAANEDDVTSQKAIAGIYLKDAGNKTKKARAVNWLNRASELGDRQAKEFLASLDPKEIESLSNLCSILYEEDQKQIEAQRREASLSAETLQASDSDFNSVRTTKSLFHVRPYFLIQERQGAVPSVAVGLTPGLAYKQWALRLHTTASMLNIALGSPFAAFETSLMAQYRLGNSFIEAGGGAEFWPDPGGTVSTFSVGYGTDISHTLLGTLLVKNITFGYSQSFFEDRVHKLYIGVGF